MRPTCSVLSPRQRLDSVSKTKTKSVACIVDREVIRRIRQHARGHMKTEVCGVLIGEHRDGTICVDECIAGINAAQAGSHVTFTQDTWEHVYKIKDKEFPNARIVGWYHSHPGFGVFLSEHDIFIHENFFSSRDQVAWVYDPHSDEEGCFGWAGSRIERVASIQISDSRGGEAADLNQKHPAAQFHGDEESDLEIVRPAGENSPVRYPWAVLLLSHILALSIGFLIAWFVFPRIVVVGVPVDPQTGHPLVDPALALPDSAGGAAGQAAPAPDLNKANPQAPSTPKAESGKGNDARPR